MKSSRSPGEKIVWGKVEKLGKGTKASYDPDRKVLTFCFKRDPQTSGAALKVLRELLLRELTELGYIGRMKYNGEVVVDGIAEENVVLVKKNHKLVIHLNKKDVGKNEESSSESESQ